MAVKWELPEIDSDKADALRVDFRKAIHELIAPDIFSVEAAHALTRAERFMTKTPCCRHNQRLEHEWTYL